jgi:hypothetical protein
MIALVEQFLETPAAMVASDGFVKVPPDAFYRIALGRIFGQEMDFDAVAPAIEVLPDDSALVKGSIVQITWIFR